MPRRLLAPLLALLVVLAVGGTAVPAGATSYFYVVTPIMFVPKDWSATSAEVQAEAAALRSALTEVKTFYATNRTPGSPKALSYTLQNLVVVQANGFKEAYSIRWNGRNIYVDGIQFTGNVEALVVNELNARGYPTPPGQNVGGHLTPVFVKGAGQLNFGRSFLAPDLAPGGWAMQGDWNIDSIQGQVPEGAYPWGSGRRIQTGALARAIGHALRLRSPADYIPPQPNNSSVMGNFGLYPNVGFNAPDRSILSSAPSTYFFNAM